MENLKSRVKMYNAGFLAIAILLAMLTKPTPQLASLDYIEQTSIFIKKVDLNGDKEEDIVAINNEKNKLYYFLNLGGDKYEGYCLTNLETKTPQASLTITITSKSETSVELSFLIPLQPAELELKIEDKDEDGDIDIFIGDLRGSRWFINDGQGKFTKKDEKFRTYLEITYTE